MSYIVFEAVVSAQSCVKRCFVSASRASSLRFTTVGDIRQAWKGDDGSNAFYARNDDSAASHPIELNTQTSLEKSRFEEVEHCK